MALDLGRPLILCHCRLAGCPQIAHPAGGMAHFLQVTALKPLQRAPRLVLHLLGASPDWLIVTCQAPDRGVASGIGFRPGTTGGFGAASAVACVLSRGRLALAFYHCVPFWLDACQALRWGGLCLGLVWGPILRWRLISVVPLAKGGIPFLRT